MSEHPAAPIGELLGAPSWTSRRLALSGGGIAMLAALPMILTNSYYTTIATNVMITLMLTLSLNFVIGRLGLFSMAHSAFLGIGAYVAAIMAQRHGVSPWLTLPCSILASMGAAAIIGVPVLRLRGMFLAVSTMAFGLFADVFTRQATDLTGGAYGITDIPPLHLFGQPIRGAGQYELALASLLLVVLIFRNIKDSSFGRAIIATRDNEPAAAAAGINIARTRLAGFVLAAAIAGCAGWLYSFFHLTVNPYILSLDITFLWLFMVLVGGLGSMLGVTIATILLGVGPELIGFATTQQVLISGILVLVVALAAPRGVGGLLEDAGRFLRNRQG